MSELKDFEQRMIELEEINENLRNPDTGLEEAVKQFEKGVKLAKSLEKDLSKIERKIEILVTAPAQKEEKPSFALFPDLDES